MSEIQAKLEQYRLRKRRTQQLEAFTSGVKNFFMLGLKKDAQPETVVDVEDETTTKTDNIPEDSPALSEESDIDIPEKNLPANLEPESKLLKYTKWTVYVLFWLTLLVIAIELQFGMVFLMFSALLGIYFNTRTGPKKLNEISAYSVFNKNCEGIDGTLTAEQFEREMRYGAGSVK